MESVGYCVRVQAIEGYKSKVLGLAYDHIIAVKHLGGKGDNPHYHLVIKTPTKAQAFRVRMKNAFPDGKGNSHMSIKPWDGDDKAISYLFHEEQGDDLAEILRWDGIPRERIDYFRTLNVKVKASVEENKKKSSHLLWETAYEHFRKNPPNHYKDIAKFMVLDALRNDKYVPQAWLLKAMTFKVMFLLRDGDVIQEEYTARHILDEIWPDKSSY